MISKTKITVSVDTTVIEAFRAINKELDEGAGHISLSLLVNRHLKAFLAEQYPGYLKSK